MGKTKIKVKSNLGHTLILTPQSRDKFLTFIPSKCKYADLDLETAVDYELSVNNPHS